MAYSNTFLYRMPAGIPGAINRSNQSTVEAQFMNTGTPFPSYGLPGVIDATTSKFRPVAAGDTAAAIYGIIARPYPYTGNGTDGLGVAVPGVLGTCNVLKRGYISVLLNGTTASAKNGPVYVRVGGAATGKPIGGIEAAPDATPANTVLLPGNSYFMGSPDANGNVEIVFNI